MEKAYVYLRVSSVGQLQGDGPERQRKAILAFARANRVDLVGWYEESESGTKEDRPELARLMIDLEANGHEVQTVIIEKLDRLARDLMVQEAIIRDFNKAGVQLISVHEGRDLAADDPTRKLVRQVLGAIVEYDKTMTVLKLKAARERIRKRTGKCEGRKRYGEQSEEERALAKRIRLMRRKRRGGLPGMTCSQIAEKLNEEGSRTRTGKQWTRQSVHHLATSPKH